MSEQYCNNQTNVNEITDHYLARQTEPSKCILADLEKIYGRTITYINL